MSVFSLERYHFDYISYMLYQQDYIACKKHIIGGELITRFETSKP